MRAWHFLPEDKKLKYGDGREVVLGETITVDPAKLNLCNYGLHASVKALDALSFLNWPDAIICRVELGGKVLGEGDKHVASERTVIAWCDADAILHQFAIRVALDCLPYFEDEFPGDLRPRKAIETKMAYLQGRATLKDLEAAAVAAAAAVREARAAAADSSAAAVAAAAAADSSAAAAVREAPRSAWAAVWAAASWAAPRSAWAATREKYNTWLEEMFSESLGLK